MTLVGLVTILWTMKLIFRQFDSFVELRVVQMPRYGDLAIIVTTNGQQTKLILLPHCVYARYVHVATMANKNTLFITLVGLI